MFRKLLDGWRRRTGASANPADTGADTPAAEGNREAPLPEHNLESVDLSAAAFVGLASQGPVATPVAIGGATEFSRIFGLRTPGHLGDAVRTYFANGGQRLYILRLAELPEDAAATRTALAALDGLDDLGLLALPGVTAPAVLQAAAGYCEDRRQLMLLADCPAAARSVFEAEAHADALLSSYVALYHPWLRDLAAAGPIPPSGAMAGLLAREEIAGRIWRPPAGPAAALNGITGLDCRYDDEDLEALIRHNINPIRIESGKCVAWGARTLGDGPECRYVNVRRYASFVEASIRRGTGWTASEPNIESTWTAVRRSIELFLLLQWRAGALQGEKPQDALFVRCGRDTMSQEDIDEGRLVVQVGLAMLKPAEFIVLRIDRSTATV
jgi:uncharacterized protein